MQSVAIISFLSFLTAKHDSGKALNPDLSFKSIYLNEKYNIIKIFTFQKPSEDLMKAGCLLKTNTKQ